MKTFDIGEIRVEPGTKVCSSFRVGEMHDGTPVNLQFIVLNGQETGPVLLVASGINGEIVSSVEAARRIAKQTDPQKLKGTMIVVPVVNQPAYLLRDRNNLLENPEGDLFYIFPGKQDGGLTERIAHIMTESIISKAQYLVDLHNMGTKGLYEPFVVVYPGLAEANLQQKLIEFAKSFGAPHVVDAGVAGPVAPKYAGRPQTIAGSKGILSFMSQIGGGFRFEETDIEHQVKGVSNVMKYLHMIEGRPDSPSRYLLSKGPTQIRSKSGGFLSLEVRLGEKVAKGQKIGEISSLFYDRIEEIEAPLDGYITMIPTAPSVCSGDIVVHISAAQSLS